MNKSLFYFIVLVNLILIIPFTLSAQEMSCQVLFIGVEDEKLTESLHAASALDGMVNREALTSTSLKRRAEGDIVNLIQALHAEGFYNAKIDLKIDSSQVPLVVAYLIDTGPVYPLAKFQIVDEGVKRNAFPMDSISLADLGITIGMPALPRMIVAAEDALLRQAAAKGFPHFQIVSREAIADQQKKNLSVVLHIDSGPLMYFDQTTIAGHSSVKEEFLRNKIAWKEGERFDMSAISQTQANLEKSGLFSSVTITYQPPEQGMAMLPMEIQLTEAKQRSIAGGLSYTTQRGIGVSGEWEHRNVLGLGRTVNVQSTLWRDTQEAKLTYTLPDFGQVDQNLIWQAIIENEDLVGYSETSLTLSGMLDRKISKQLKITYGLEYKSIATRHSENNGSYNLIRTPLQLRWSTANSILDPTEGASVNFKMTPGLQLVAPYFAFCPTTLSGSYYHPLTDDHRVVFAAKGTVGSIIGGPFHGIPSSERFFAGGDNNLRGYRYQSVSPLDKEGKLSGGRSLMTLSLEARLRLSETIGLVGFYDVGNVYESGVPQLGGKQLQSVGVGLRYHTPVGPLRLDFAVPLDRRREHGKYIDDSYQIYMSIGQSF